MSHQGVIAFFGHNSNDAAVRRRAIAFQQAGYQVLGFMPHRGVAPDYDWLKVDLGITHDNAYFHRIKSIFAGADTVQRHGDMLAAADLIYARNLDMLMLAVRARYLCKSTVPIVYECLDVHHRLTGDGFAARSARQLERWLLARCDAIVVSSPRFETEHFAIYYPGTYRSFLIENRLIEGDGFPQRPTPTMPNQTSPLKIGWFGNLRCKKSLGLLTDIARKFPDDLEIHLRGYPAKNVIPDFESRIAGLPNVSYGGKYRSPQDLGTIYGEVDLIWAGDWYEEGANSLWLLPNRIYEGGYFATPALAPKGTQTAAWLAEKGGAFFLSPPVADALEQTVRDLIADRSALTAKQIALLDLPRDIFVEPPEAMNDLFNALVSPKAG